jgi:hypothetical protein
MSSLRKPKRIRIYGTDEKEYLFLVKVRGYQIMKASPEMWILTD